MTTWNKISSSFLNKTLLILLGVIGLLGFTFYNHVKEREEYLSERNFRHLSQIADNLSETIGLYGKILRVTFNSDMVLFADDIPPLSNGENKKGKAPCHLKPTPEVTIANIPSMKRFYERYLNLLIPSLCRLKGFYPKEIKINEFLPEFSEGDFSPQFLRHPSENLNRKMWPFQIKGKIRPCGNCNTRSIHLKGEFNLDLVLDDLIFGPVFSTVVLAKEDGRVLYQMDNKRHDSPPLPTQLERVDKLFKSENNFLSRSNVQFLKNRTQENSGNMEEANTKLNFLGELPTVFHLPLGGVDYKVFAQAKVLPTCKGSSFFFNKCENLKIILLGFIPNNQLQRETWAVSDELLLLLVMIFLAGSLSIPFLKLVTVGSGDRFGLLDTLAVMFTSLLGTAVLSLILLDIYGVHIISDIQRNRIKDGVRQMQDSFKSELIQVLLQLKGVKFLMEDVGKANSIGNSEKKLCETESSSTIHEYERILKKFFPENTPCVNLLKDPFAIYSDYLFVTRLLEIGEDGRIKRIGTINPEVILTADLSDRDYYKRARMHDLWAIPSSEIPFILDPVYTWDNGQYGVMVATPMTQNQGKESKDSVIAINVPFFSLTNVILPPGFGYAVTTKDGSVLFHSKQNRNRRENFLRETDDNPQLRALFHSGQEGFVNGQYYGTDRLFYLSNLHKALPWRLVVFVDKTWERTANLEILFFAVGTFLLYTLLILGVGLFGLFVYWSISKGQGGWMWPQLRKRDYFNIRNLNLSLIAIFFFLQWIGIVRQSLATLFLSGFLIPISGMAYMGWRLTQSTTIRSHGKGILPSFRFAYISMSMSCLLVYAAIPITAFFLIGLHNEIKLFLSHEVQTFAEQVETRHKVIGQYYQQFHIADKTRKTMFPTLKNREILSADPTVNLEKVTGIYPSFFYSKFNSSLTSPAETNTSVQLVNYSFVYVFWRNWLRLWHNPIAEQLGGHFDNKPWQSGPSHITLIDLSEPPSIQTNFKFQISNILPDFTDKIWGTFIILLLAVSIVLVLAWLQEMKRLQKLKRLLYFKKLRAALAIFGLILVGLNIIIFGNIVEQWKEVKQFLFWGQLTTVFVGLTYYFPRKIAKNLFWLDYSHHRALNPNALFPDTNADCMRIMVILPPDMPAGNLSGHLPFSSGLWSIIDFTQPQTFENDWASLAGNNATPILFLEMDYRAEDSEFDRQKMHLLTTSLSSPQPVIIVSRRDLLSIQFSKSANNPENKTSQNESALLRWIHLLKSFVVIHPQWNDSLSFFPKTLTNYIKNPNDGDISNTWEELVKKMTKDPEQSLSTLWYYYEGIWAFLSESEKLALWHLAVDRFLHIHNPDLPKLLDKRLVAFNPDLRLTSKTFQQFVLEVGHRDNIGIIENKIDKSWWKRFSLPLAVVILVGVIFLAVTQEKVGDVLIAFIPLLPALLASFPKIIGAFQGIRNASSG